MERPDLSYARVLVVDDLQTNLSMMAYMLRKYNIHVDCVSSGSEAYERMRAGEPVYHAVFIDYMMPGMDGIEAAAAIRSIDTDYAKSIPLIAVTITEDESLFLKNGFQDFLQKPVNIVSLDATVQRWIKKR